MRARHLVTSVIAWAFLALSVQAQEKEVRTISFEGPEIVCHILHSLEMVPIQRFDDATKRPKESVIIVFGEPRALRSPEMDRKLKQFLNDGGSLLIATDRGLDNHELGIHVAGTVVSVPVHLKKRHAYHEEVTCPLLRPEEPAMQRIKVDRDQPRGFWVPEVAGRDHPLFSFLQKGIATNCPSYLDVEEGPSLHDLSVFPFGNRFAMSRWNLRGGPRRYMIGSPKDAPPLGRALYIAGHGMFMNGMMIQTDSDNFDFTVNAVRWLREGPNGSTRTKALFVVDGTILTDFDMKLTPPLPPIPVPPVKMLNRLIRGLENERFFHRVLAEVLGDWRGRLIGVLLGLVTFGLLLYGAKKVLAGRHHLETAVPTLLGPQPAPTSSAPSRQRQQAMLRQVDFWEVSYQLVLEWFHQEFDVTPERWLVDVAAQFHVEGPFWSRWRMQPRADEMLRLARSTIPATVSRHQFFVLVETLKQLSRAREDGRLALLVEGKNVRQT